MTEKQKLIKAFQSLDFNELNNLLDDNRSYMDVSKDLFLSRLKQELDEYSDLNSYENVIEGTCGHCNKGCKAYSFTKKGCPSLNLFFEEKQDKITDIYLCNKIKVENPDKRVISVYFMFYEEEKVEFKPSIKYSILLQNTERAIKAFNNLESMGLVPVQEVVHWHNRVKYLADELGLGFPFSIISYKAFIPIDSLYREVSYLVRNYNENHIAQKALREYQQFDKKNEKMLISWLLNHKDSYFFSLKKTDNWRETGILILETEPNLVVDCSDCLDSFIFDEIYNNHFYEIMTKYEPTKKHYEQNGGSVEYDLEVYLKLHNKI